MSACAVWSSASTEVPAEDSPAFAALGVVHAFALRQPGIEVEVDKDESLERLRPTHEALRTQLGLAGRRLCTAEQVHGAEVALADPGFPGPLPGVDALITNDPTLTLGIYTADCCAVFLADPVSRVIALVHSGAKGTRLGVVPRTVERMCEAFGCVPARVTALLGPCIRPPFYEWDFAAEIRSQLEGEGVRTVLDPQVCTASHPGRYYSYRRELGKTGRMLALLALGNGASVKAP